MLTKADLLSYILLDFFKDVKHKDRSRQCHIQALPDWGSHHSIFWLPLVIYKWCGWGGGRSAALPYPWTNYFPLNEGGYFCPEKSFPVIWMPREFPDGLTAGGRAYCSLQHLGQMSWCINCAALLKSVRTSWDKFPCLKAMRPLKPAKCAAKVCHFYIDR